jgi:SNF2 family DNA or RNA helicase
MTNPQLVITKLSDSLDLVATTKGLYFSPSEDLNGRHPSHTTWSTQANPTPLASKLFSKIPSLIEQEIAHQDKDGVSIPFNKLPVLEEIDFDFLAECTEWSPFTVSVSAFGALGRPDFLFRADLLTNNQKVYGQRVGPFYKRGRQVYRLSPATYRLLECLDEFNALPPQERTKARALQAAYEVQQFTKIALLDNYLKGEKIILPETVKLDIDADEAGYLSLIPRFDGVDPKTMRDTFMAHNTVRDVYDVRNAEGERVRVVVNDQLQDVLRSIQRVRHVGGDLRDKLLVDVRQVLDEGIDFDLIDMDGFAPRVRGIGEPPHRAKIVQKRPSRDWADVQTIANLAQELCLKVQTDQGEAQVEFNSSAEVEELNTLLQDAAESGQASIHYKGHKLFVDEPLVESVREASDLMYGAPAFKHDAKTIRSKLKNCRYLLIYSNEELREYDEGSEEEYVEVPLSNAIVPISLKGAIQGDDNKQHPISLKEHQLTGLKWLQYLFLNREKQRGCLLADDMGLGKTLQILSFLAWCVEDGYVEGLGSDSPPYEPILIVTPLMLLDTWNKEIDKYFGNDIFSPRITLWDSNLKRLTRTKQKEKEVALGAPKLNLDDIRSHRLVITTYDTVKNYQHSFARIPWSVIVTDEAQDFKEQNARSDALKSLRALFKIVATGTPVENRLLDLWNLLDYMQPGTVVGSSKDFSDKYEKDLEEKSEEEREELSLHLRRRLRYGRPDAFVLRREKAECLADLPPKNELLLPSDLSPTQRAAHVSFVNAIQTSSEKPHHFELLHYLRKLYLHPLLAEGESTCDDTQAWIEASPKLKSVVEVLKGIRRKNEKVLIFALTQKMQDILQKVLGEVFSLSIDIINGNPQSKRSGNTSYRQGIIDRFSEKEGFNILILSPRVAGVGLTITSANNVIHYERWWNPAKEAQATDRVYRIGQTKPVTVYYPVSKDPEGQFTSFDEKLAALLEDKKRLAKDFLTPSAAMSLSDEEFLQSFTSPSAASKAPPSSGGLVIDSLEKAKRLHGHQFEALMATLYEKQGYRVILGPKTRDRGIDITALGNKDLVLIQCKHTSVDGPLCNDAIEDLEEGGAFYRKEIFSPAMARFLPSRRAWTNGRFDSETKGLATRLGVELRENRDLSALLVRYRPTLADIAKMEAQRARSRDEIAQRCRALHP